MDATSDVISQYVKVVESDGSDSCPVCLGAPKPLTVELTRCRHRLHFTCLNAMLSCQQPPMYMPSLSYDLRREEGQSTAGHDELDADTAHYRASRTPISYKSLMSKYLKEKNLHKNLNKSERL
ncbi:uncharacterized protein LOC120359542 [Solenopsis invicta]|uniref:uncharacterized protein LOC120359542 n=1 Tax=Solenopsis invicta TaxID=13686 RepID=UPI00193D258E|nr:uncharacterized protein LOC120359542 [Solenopsis invicta]